MKLYGGDWLTNAALVGYIRIQRRIDNLPKISDGYVEIKDSDLKLFADAYFTIILEQYMNNAFIIKSANRQKLIKNLNDQQKKSCVKKIDAFLQKWQRPIKLNFKSFTKSSKTQLDYTKKYQSEIKQFLARLQKEFGIEKKTLTSVINDIEKKMDKIIVAISGNSQKFIPLSLSKFYFNKSIVGNYSLGRGMSRYDAFKQIFVEPAITTIKNSPTSGQITCKICKQNKIHISSFDKNILNETMFSPTMVSSNKFSNFFYNNQSDLFICSMCELVLLCSWAGFNPIPLNTRDNLSKSDQIFVNLPDINMSLEQNDSIRDADEGNSYRFKDTIYSQTIQKILTDKQKQKSKWTVQNFFFVEIKTVSRKDTEKPDFRYYHIGKNVAMLFEEDKITKALSHIKGKLPLENGSSVNLITHVIEKIITEQSLDDTCSKLCKYIISNSKSNRSWELFNICVISSVRNVLNCQHRGNNVNQLSSNVVYGILNTLKTDGSKLASKINQPKKSKSLSFVLLEAIRNNNTDKFYDVISKLYITNELPIPDGLLSILNQNDAVTPNQRAYAFLSGFSNPKGDKQQ